MIDNNQMVQVYPTVNNKVYPLTLGFYKINQIVGKYVQSTMVIKKKELLLIRGSSFAMYTPQSLFCFFVFFCLLFPFAVV